MKLTSAGPGKGAVSEVITLRGRLFLSIGGCENPAFQIMRGVLGDRIYSDHRNVIRGEIADISLETRINFAAMLRSSYR